jgi:hypothetical protein
MIRTPNIQLIVRSGKGHSNEAYDIKKDARETVNIIDQVRKSDEYESARVMLDSHFIKFRVAENDGFGGNIPKHNGGEPWLGVTGD